MGASPLKRRVVPLALCMWLGLSLVVAAQTPPAQPKPAPSPALLDKLTGTWVLRGTIEGKLTTHDVDVSWVLNHGYLRLHEVSRERTGSCAP